MKGIGGNKKGLIQVKDGFHRSSIGESVPVWTDAITLKGWLDLQTGDTRTSTYNAKIEESTHVFIADYQVLPDVITNENSRMIINEKIYEIKYIDNPMEMESGSQLEIYLKFTGGQ